MKKMLKMISLVLVLSMALSTTVLANDTDYDSGDLANAEQSDFEIMIERILSVKEEHPDFTEDEILEIMDDDSRVTRGIGDIWNALTDSEKSLCIRYPFAALKVNEAKKYSNGSNRKQIWFEWFGRQK